MKMQAPFDMLERCVEKSRKTIELIREKSKYRNYINWLMTYLELDERYNYTLVLNLNYTGLDYAFRLKMKVLTEYENIEKIDELFDTELCGLNMEVERFRSIVEILVKNNIYNISE